MRCFFLADPPLKDGTTILLPQVLQHHLATVLRLTPGAEVQLFDGRGRVADAILQRDGCAELRLVRVFPQPSFTLTLIQGLPKGDKAELILQKGTELGVNRFLMVPMARSIVRLKRESRQSHRWEKIIQEAARQCHQYHVPELQPVDTFTNALAATADSELKLLLWEQSRQPLAAVLADRVPRSITVVVGPEGGISSAEAAQAQLNGYRLVSLGPRILRTETAGLALIAVLQYLYGDLSQRTDDVNIAKGLRGKDSS